MVKFKDGDESLIIPSSNGNGEYNPVQPVSGSSVQWFQYETGGTHIADIKIDGVRTAVYAPSAVTEEIVEEMIDSSLTEYNKTQNFKTINGNSIIGQGDIEIKSEGNYSRLQKLDDYFYDITYDEIDYEFANNYFGNNPQPIIGGCTCVAKGDIIGRNYDWLYNEEVAFEVHTPATKGRNRVDGVAGSLSALTKDTVEQYGNEEAYKLLPFYLQDGHNEYGLFAEMNVVPASGNTCTVPRIEKRESVNAIMLVRYILDKFGKENDLEYVVDYLKDYVEICFPSTLTDMGYETHYLLKQEGQDAVVLEVVENHLVSIVADKPVLTNFRLYGTTLTGETYNTPFTANNGDYPRENGIEDFGSGIERANIALLAYDDVESEDDMTSLMDDLRFSQAYSDLGNDSWYSEFVGGSIDVNTPSEDFAFQDRMLTYRQKWEERSRSNPEVWITSHCSVYDLSMGKMTVFSQEGTESFVFYLDDFSQVQNMIDNSLENYYDKTDVEALIEAEISDMPTDSEVEEMIEEAIAAETARTESTYQKILEAGEGVVINDNVISFAGGEISGITEAKAQELIDNAISAETARTEETYLKEHQSLSGYATESYVNSKGDDLIGYVDGKVSGITSVVDAKLAEYTKTADFATINGQKIVEGGDITVSGATGAYLPLSGGTLTGDLNMGAYSHINLTKTTGSTTHTGSIMMHTSGETCLKHITDNVEDAYLKLDGRGGIIRYSGENGTDIQGSTNNYIVDSKVIRSIWTGTQAEFDALSSHSNTVLYFIKQS